ncbi:MAG: HD-GYP domain-containing protein [Candidatus Humimicrobiaceae bacterium]
MLIIIKFVKWNFKSLFIRKSKDAYLNLLKIFYQHSRIILIVDAYDVMTTGRIYKNSMSKTEAIEELKRCAGAQFDPIIVNKFIEILST